MIAPTVDVNITHAITLSSDTSEPRTLFIARTLTFSQSNRISERVLKLKGHLGLAKEFQLAHAAAQAEYASVEKASPCVAQNSLVARISEAEQGAVEEGRKALVLACEMFELLYFDCHNTPAEVKKVKGEFGPGISREWAMDNVASSGAVMELVMAAIEKNRLGDEQRKNSRAQSGSAAMPPASTALNASIRDGGSAVVAPAPAVNSTGSTVSQAGQPSL
jgi:hypothetical protein